MDADDRHLGDRVTFIRCYLAFNTTRKPGVEFSAEELASIVEKTIAQIFPRIGLKKGAVQVATVGPPTFDVTAALQRVKGEPMEDPREGVPHPMVKPTEEKPPVMNVKPVIAPSLPSIEPRLILAP